MDYKQYLDKNKSKIIKRLIYLNKIKPSDKFAIHNIEEIPRDKNGSCWELTLLMNDTSIYHWRMSASIFQQIVSFCDKNGDTFYVQPDKKVFIGKTEVWTLILSTSPIDKPSNQKTITHKEQPDVAQQQLDRSPGLGRADAQPVSVSSHTEQPEVTQKEARQDTSTPKSVEAELTTQEEPEEASAEALPINDKAKIQFACQRDCSVIYSRANKEMHKEGKSFISITSKMMDKDVKKVAQMWLAVTERNLPLLSMDNGEPISGVNRGMIEKISYQCREILGKEQPVPIAIPDAAKVTVEVPAPTPEPLSPAKPIVGINPDAFKKAKDNIEKKGFGNIFDDEEDMGKMVL